jgi:hypothetical protein
MEGVDGKEGTKKGRKNRDEGEYKNTYYRSQNTTNFILYYEIS